MKFLLLALGVCITTTRTSLAVTADANVETSSSSKSSVTKSTTFRCDCPGPLEILPWVDDESKLGNSDIDTCNSHDDDNSWFTQLYYDESQANPTMHYRYCERKKTRKRLETCTSSSYLGTWTAQYVSDSYADTPTCGGWKQKTIPDKTNFRAFFDEGIFGWEKDYTCGSNDGFTYCYKNTGSPDHAALAYSNSGTVCFRYDLETCDDVDKYCWGTGQHGCDKDNCKTQCYSLTDSSKIYTLAFNSFGDTPTYYVELTFNNEDVKKISGSSSVTIRKSYLYGIIGLPFILMNFF